MRSSIGFYADRSSRVRDRAHRRRGLGRFTLAHRARAGDRPVLILARVARPASGERSTTRRTTRCSPTTTRRSLAVRSTASIAAANSLGQFLGPLVGGLLALLVRHWRVPFLVFWIPTAGLVVLGICEAARPRPRRPRARGDGRVGGDDRHRGGAAVVRRGVADLLPGEDAATDLVLAAVPRGLAVSAWRRVFADLLRRRLRAQRVRAWRRSPRGPRSADSSASSLGAPIERSSHAARPRPRAGFIVVRRRSWSRSASCSLHARPTSRSPSRCTHAHRGSVRDPRTRDLLRPLAGDPPARTVTRLRHRLART